MRSRLTAILASSLFLVLVLVAPANAAYPGTNGRILFTSDRDAPSRQSDIYTMNADGAGVTRLTTYPGNDNEAAWSPDGSKIAFVRDAQVFTMNADGGNQVPISGSDGASDPSWSPDGTKLVFSGYRGSAPN